MESKYESSLSVRLLGPFQVTLDERPVTGFRSDKVRALLAYLVAEADRPHRREALAGLLWPEWPERTARTNLRRALADLRQVIGDHDATPPFLLITRQTVHFNSDSDAWIDVTAFAALHEAPGQTIRQLEEAVALYRGDFLEGFSIAGRGRAPSPGRVLRGTRRFRAGAPVCLATGRAGAMG